MVIVSRKKAAVLFESIFSDDKAITCICVHNENDGDDDDDDDGVDVAPAA